MIWKQEIDLNTLNKFCQGNLAENLGIAFTGIGDDYLEATMPVDERTKQPMGLLHGGATVALAETLGSVASTISIPDLEQEMAVGVEINANHLRPVFSGKVTGRVTAVRIGKQIHVWNIEVRDDRGKLNCVSRITIAIVAKR